MVDTLETQKSDLGLVLITQDSVMGEIYLRIIETVRFNGMLFRTCIRIYESTNLQFIVAQMRNRSPCEQPRFLPKKTCSNGQFLHSV